MPPRPDVADAFRDVDEVDNDVSLRSEKFTASWNLPRVELHGWCRTGRADEAEFDRFLVLDDNGRAGCVVVVVAAVLRDDGGSGGGFCVVPNVSNSTFDTLVVVI